MDDLFKTEPAAPLAESLRPKTIAEVIGQFDLVGVVELRDRIGEMAEVMKILGGYWDIIYSDFIEDAGGNRERVAYLFDRRACVFTGLAGSANEPRKKVKGEYVPERSWWRKPFMASFRAGNFDFIALTTHIRWGDGETLHALFSRSRGVRRQIIDAGQDTAAPDFGREHP